MFKGIKQAYRDYIKVRDHIKMVNDVLYYPIKTSETGRQMAEQLAGFCIECEERRLNKETEQFLDNVNLKHSKYKTKILNQNSTFDEIWNVAKQCGITKEELDKCIKTLKKLKL